MTAAESIETTLATWLASAPGCTLRVSMRGRLAASTHATA